MSGLCPLQVSVLTDQVEAQGEKIRDLDLCLDEHREKLNATEEMLQQVCLSWQVESFPLCVAQNLGCSCLISTYNAQIFFFSHTFYTFLYLTQFLIVCFACRNFFAELRWRHRSLSWCLKCPISSWSWMLWTRTEWTSTDLGTVKWVSSVSSEHTLTQTHCGIWHLFALLSDQFQGSAVFWRKWGIRRPETSFVDSVNSTLTHTQLAFTLVHIT